MCNGKPKSWCDPFGSRKGGKHTRAILVRGSVLGGIAYTIAFVRAQGRRLQEVQANKCTGRVLHVRMYA